MLLGGTQQGRRLAMFGSGRYVEGTATDQDGPSPGSPQERGRDETAEVRGLSPNDQSSP